MVSHGDHDGFMKYEQVLAGAWPMWQIPATFIKEREKCDGSVRLRSQPRRVFWL